MLSGDFKLKEDPELVYKKNYILYHSTLFITIFSKIIEVEGEFLIFLNHNFF